MLRVKNGSRKSGSRRVLLEVVLSPKFPHVRRAQTRVREAVHAHVLAHIPPSDVARLFPDWRQVFETPIVMPGFGAFSVAFLRVRDC